jgi:hypothetical protein
MIVIVQQLSERTDELLLRPLRSYLSVVFAMSMLGHTACHGVTRPTSSQAKKDSGVADASSRANEGGMDANLRGNDGGTDSARVSPATDSGEPEAVHVSGEPCGSAPRVLLDLQALVPDRDSVSTQTASPIAVNATDLYFVFQWSVQGLPDWYLMRIPLGGGTVARIATIPSRNGEYGRHALALTNTDVIFLQGGDTIAKVPLDGGATTTLAKAADALNTVLVNEQNAYFADSEGAKSVPLIGGTVRTLAPDILLGLALVNDRLYMATRDNKIYSISTNGGDPTPVGDGGGWPLIGCGGKNVCWLGGPGSLRATLMQLAPGGTPVTLAEGFPEPLDLLFDGNNFFITLAHPGEIIRVPATGGTAAGAYVELGMTNLALNDTCLFWSSATTITSVSRDAADVAVLSN